MSISLQANAMELYIGIKNNLERRTLEHKSGKNTFGFTTKYGVRLLVYFEEFTDVKQAIQREKQIKSGSRKKKIELIELKNKDWNDLLEN